MWNGVRCDTLIIIDLRLKCHRMHFCPDMVFKQHVHVVTGVFAVIILNGRYPQVTLIDSSLASGSSSHTTVVVPECLDQSPTTPLTPQTSLLIITLIDLISDKGQTFVIAPQEAQSRCRSAQVYGTHQAASHIPALDLPSRSRYSFTDHLRMEG